eukprot:90640-Pelagomonas_calceolata.AAC.5
MHKPLLTPTTVHHGKTQQSALTLAVSPTNKSQTGGNQTTAWSTLNWHLHRGHQVRSAQGGRTHITSENGQHRPADQLPELTSPGWHARGSG